MSTENSKNDDEDEEKFEVKFDNVRLNFRPRNLQRVLDEAKAPNSAHEVRFVVVYVKTRFASIRLASVHHILFLARNFKFQLPLTFFNERLWKRFPANLAFAAKFQGLRSLAVEAVAEETREAKRIKLDAMLKHKEALKNVIFICPLCEARYRFKSTLKKHFNKEHPEESWRPEKVEAVLINTDDSF